MQKAQGEGEKGWGLLMICENQERKVLLFISITNYSHSAWHMACTTSQRGKRGQKSGNEKETKEKEKRVTLEKTRSERKFTGTPCSVITVRFNSTSSDYQRYLYTNHSSPQSNIGGGPPPPSDFLDFILFLKKLVKLFAGSLPILGRILFPMERPGPTAPQSEPCIFFLHMFTFSGYVTHIKGP